jgi:hypothetical protein
VLTYDQIHPILRGVIGVFEGMRKVGFVSDDIFVEVNRHPDLAEDELMVFVALKTQGREFLVSVGPWPCDKVDDLHAQWIVLCEAMNKNDVVQADMDRIWQESLVFRDKVGFATAIAMKGIAAPGTDAPPIDPGAFASAAPTRVFTVPCEFCSGTVTYQIGNLSLAHSKPTCKKFRKLDVLAFVEATNRSVKKKHRESLS